MIVGKLQNLIDISDKTYKMVLYKAITPTQYTFRYNFTKNCWEETGTPITVDNLVVIADFKKRRIYKDYRRRELVNFAIMNGQNMSGLKDTGIERFVTIAIRDSEALGGRKPSYNKNNGKRPTYRKPNKPPYKKEEPKKESVELGSVEGIRKDGFFAQFWKRGNKK